MLPSPSRPSDKQSPADRCRVRGGPWALDSRTHPAWPQATDARAADPSPGKQELGSLPQGSVLVDAAAQVPSRTRVCTCVCARLWKMRAQGPCRPTAAPCPAPITATVRAAQALRSCLRHAWVPALGPSPPVRLPRPPPSPQPGRKVSVPASPTLGPDQDSHLLQLLTPVQAGQPLNPVVRQLPGDRPRAVRETGRQEHGQACSAPCLGPSGLPSSLQGREGPLRLQEAWGTLAGPGVGAQELRGR